jgi:hypothetical protein
VLEGVNDFAVGPILLRRHPRLIWSVQVNQATIHTSLGCKLATTDSGSLGMTGSLIGGPSGTDCSIADQGCGVVSNSTVSYGGELVVCTSPARDSVLTQLSGVQQQRRRRVRDALGQLRCLRVRTRGLTRPVHSSRHPAGSSRVQASRAILPTAHRRRRNGARPWQTFPVRATLARLPARLTKRAPRVYSGKLRAVHVLLAAQPHLRHHALVRRAPRRAWETGADGRVQRRMGRRRLGRVGHARAGAVVRGPDGRRGLRDVRADPRRRVRERLYVALRTRRAGGAGR